MNELWQDPSTRRSVLVIDDDPLVRRALARELTHRGHDVRVAGTHVEAMTIARDAQPELAIVDLRMPDGSGLELVRRLRELSSEMRVVVLTAYASLETAVDAVHLGADAYVAKPAGTDVIFRALERADNPLRHTRDPGEETPGLEQLEREHIHRVLAAAGGNVSEAARRLGIHRRSLQRKLRRGPM
jgi:two-component system response regulator RegA